MSPPWGAGDDRFERQWLDDSAAVEDRPADSTANLASLGFLTAAVRRSAWFWRVSAAVGLLAGAGVYLAAPHTYQASTTLLLTVGSEAQPGTAIQEDQALAQSHAVAGLAMRTLGLHQSVASFLGSYSVTPLTDRILLITASAPTSSDAVRRANVLATDFLAFRTQKLLAEQSLELAALNRQVAQEKQLLTSINRQISQLPAQPALSSQQTTLSMLRAQRDRASSDLAALQQAVSTSDAATKVTTATMIGASKVLDPASPVPPHSRLKHLIEYAAGGLIIGLMLAISFIVVRALLSDRLRRRDDVAQALGAPVRSVPGLLVSRWLPAWRSRTSGQYLQRIVAHLRDALPADERRPAALAVVPVDDPRVAARSVVSLALSCSRQGRRVVVADLSAGAQAAKLLGAKAGPGVSRVSVDGAQLVAAVPDPVEYVPVGPLSAASSQPRPANAGELAAACDSADILLTLITLDPSVGGEHLATWAADAVVMVTAGRSSWTKIHAAGEMIRLAGTRLAGAVLVGADKTDESLGVIPAQGLARDAAAPPGRQPEASVAEGSGALRVADSGVSRLQMNPPEHAGGRRRTGR